MALDAFAEAGYHDTTMEEIAARAGVTKPVLYQHFPSKHRLYLEVLREVGRRLSDAVITAADPSLSPHEQVRHGFAAYFTFIDDRPQAFAVLFGEGVRVDPEFAATVYEVESTIAGLIAELITTAGLDTLDRLTLAHGLVGLAEATGRHWLRTGRPSDAAALAAQVAELAWAGLRGRPPSVEHAATVGDPTTSGGTRTPGPRTADGPAATARTEHV